MTNNELAALLDKPIADLTHDELQAMDHGALKRLADAALDRARNASPDARRFAEQVRAAWGGQLAKVAASTALALDVVLERQRAHRDTCRVYLAAMRHLDAIADAGKRGVPFSHMPAGTDYIPEMEPRPLSVPAQPAFDLQAWCVRHGDRLLDSRFVRASTDGHNTVSIRGDWSDEDRKVFRQHEKGIAAWIAKAFEPVADDALAVTRLMFPAARSA